jgi:hypothetical protein
MAREHSWWRRVFGIDGFDVAVQAALTAIPFFWFVAASGGDEEGLLFGSFVVMGSLAVLAIRRRLALNKAERMASKELSSERLAELEQRVAELEFEQSRLADLEERLDFTERLLAQSSAVQRPPDPARLEGAR